MFSPKNFFIFLLPLRSCLEVRFEIFNSFSELHLALGLIYDFLDSSALACSNSETGDSSVLNFLIELEIPSSLASSSEI